VIVRNGSRIGSGEQAGGAPAICAVVPTLNEREHAPELVASLALDHRVEVVVADGGSSDGTREAIEELRRTHANVRLVSAPRGRGPQLRAGAAASSAAIVWFLHADTRLPQNSTDAILKAVRGGCVGGGFRLAFDDRRLALRAVAWCANVRTAITRTPFGDQALFARRDALERIGGVPDWPLFEDVELVRRLRRCGPFRVLEPRVTSSARRYRRDGLLATLLTHKKLELLYLAGASPERLAEIRYGGGPRRESASS